MPPDKSAYLKNIFLISQQNIMYNVLLRNKKNIFYVVGSQMHHLNETVLLAS